MLEGQNKRPEPLSLRAAQVQRLRRLVRDPKLRGKERAFVIESADHPLHVRPSRILEVLR